ncbi:MAG: DUF3488 domain-containing transglutaminase family protein [Colwellia sp.]|nr:DUF3488 domain-containing transglutaminase family protein [Colwellia sp.]
MISKTRINHHKKSGKFNLTYRNTWLLWCCQIINIASLSLAISSWMLAILALCLCWQALLINVKFNNKEKTLFSPILLTTFALSGCVAIAITASSLGVLLSMVHLLAFAYSLKAFEIKQRKDFYQLILLGLFLLASSLIFKQSLVFSIFIILALILNLVSLQQVFSPNKSLWASTKTVTLLLLQSSLLAIVLFVIFPRLSPFWQVPNAKSAQTGLSDEVSPGDIANLALSSDLAFRVDFKGSKIPRYSQLYWRAMTLEQYDGRKWFRTKTNKKNNLSKQPFKPLITGESIDYDVIVEPNYQFWLFGLTVATTTDPSLVLKQDYTIQSRNVLSQISHYKLKSYLQAPLEPIISDESKQRNLTINLGSNPRLEKLALTLKQKFPNPVDRSKAVLTFFREEQYFYTLKPPLLINNSLDQFFFDTKAGFCVHYASTYAYLMRAAGIPARVVTGYLGGEYNASSVPNSSQLTPQGGHLSVYQYDAHAWAEIWLAGIGWQRVDPTAAVDPQRVESGWSNALLAQQSLLNNDFVGLYQLKNIAWLNALRLQLDALDYQWTRWVLGYSNQQQYDLLTRWFGNNMPWKTGAIVLLSLIIMMILITLIYRINFKKLRRKKVSPWLQYYQQTLEKLTKKGLIKPMNMTPSCFAQQVALKFPKLSKDFFELTKNFECLSYQNLSISEQEILLVRLHNNYLKIKSNLD